MHDTWIAALVFFAVAALFAWGIMLAWALLRVRGRRADPARDATYECGEEPDGSAWIRFHPRYYVVALIFVLFDVETIFLLPWALNLDDFGLVALVEMCLFLGILLLGWLYALKKGALRWQ
ncbi:MAG: NADH-quinone oxidoreductase subunit A [Deltaproteobacteria bacterium]|nr:NADH-quinone oxidoreductase subunit A [Deltaproteobacteria bacterium]